MKIERDTIYGLIGYVIEWDYSHYLIRDFDWDSRRYLLENWRCPSVTCWVHMNDLIGAPIVQDVWEKMKNGKI